MPTQCVSVIILNAQTRDVLLKRKRIRAWSLPGGWIELGETWEEASARVAFEETGYPIEVERLVGKYRHPQGSGGGDLTYVALAHLLDDVPQSYDREAIVVSWFPIMALPRSLNRFARGAIADAISEYPFAVQRTFELPPHLAVLFWLRCLITR